jgi:hypothetical protein
MESKEGKEKAKKTKPTNQAKTHTHTHTHTHTQNRAKEINRENSLLINSELNRHH